VSGGYVSNANGVIGGTFFGINGLGTANVSSGTWANSGNFTIGDGGTGTLTMSGGLVTVGGTLSQGTFGTINLNSGGTLQIGVGGTSGVLGVSTLTNNGTLIFNRSDASTYSGIISGTGAVTKQGGGTLTLNGANSYSGATTISGGVLALSGTGSVGTGDLNLGYGGVFDLTALTSGTYSLPSTGDLIGSGTLTGNGHTLAVLGAFQPGNSPGTVTLDTGFTLDLSGATSTTFDITDPLFTAGTYDLVNGNGSMIFGGVLNLAFSGGSYADGTDVLQLFANTGGFSGDFTSVVSTGLAEGQAATFNKDTGFISITAVPEPSTYAMALAGLACGGWQMWRRRRLRQASTLAA
jgi:fibronectin-binding autotransporter adhesin